MPKTPQFTTNLLKWYHRNARDLPWRRTTNPYRIWISEIMLQQTTVSAVIPYYKDWFKTFPTIKSVARAPQQKVLKTWQGLGYYSRARNIHKTAKVITEKHKGRFPRTPAEVQRLPGFGAYTTGAVLSIAFDQRLTIIDANVRRVIMRILAIKGEATPKVDTKIEKFLEKVLPAKNCGDFNQALMELGALVCRNREPLCNQCPVRQNCLACKKGIQEIIPVPKKKVIKDVHAVIAIIKKNGRYFIQKRPKNGLFADLWEFPGGKIEKGESPRQALCREVREELGTSVTSARHLFDLKQYYTQFRAHLNVWTCQLKTYPKSTKTHRWAAKSSFKTYPMPSGSARIVDKLWTSHT